MSQAVIKHLFILCTALILFTLPHPALGEKLTQNTEERIISNDIWLQPQPDRSVIVTEVISINAQNKEIGDGIIRSVPSRAQIGGIAKVTALSAIRDGMPVRLLARGGKYTGTIEVGQPGFTTKKTGLTVYKLRYQITEQVNTVGERDSVMWNISPGGWPIPIEKLKIRFLSPEGTSPLSWTASSSDGMNINNDFTLEKISRNMISLELKRPLAVGESITVGVNWPKGAVTPPLLTEFIRGWASEYSVTASILAGYALMAIYMLFVTLRFESATKTDPKFMRPVRIGELTPVALRTFIKRRFDHRSFIASLLSMAAKGCLTIVDSGRGMVLKRNPNADYVGDLSIEEQTLDETLFEGGSRPELRVDSFNRRLIDSACRDVEWTLRDYLGPRYWRNAYRQFYVSVIVSVLVAAFVLYASVPDIFPTTRVAGSLVVFGLIFVIGGSHAVEALLISRLTGWREALLNFHIIEIIIAAAGVVWFTSFLTGYLDTLETYAVLSLFIATLPFYYFLHGPTQEGRAILKVGRNMRRYLTSPEQARSTSKASDVGHGKPLFEMWLGASYALGAEKIWRRAFRDVMRETTAGAYHPAWYQGAKFDPAEFDAKFYEHLKDSHYGK